jgi:L-histidine N-alpha-methyltransferase
LVRAAYQTPLSVSAAQHCHPSVFDLIGIEDLPQVFGQNQSFDSSRLLTFFGLIPNFEPQVILPRLASLLQAGDNLLLSANLAPGLDYEAGLQKILSLYDNALTRDWLFTFLLDLGVARQDGEMRFVIEECPANTDLKRVTANFHFNRPCQICLPEAVFAFLPGDTIRLFFSYRYTPDRVRNVLPRYGIEVIAEWITPSGEEGVFLCRKK